MRLVEFGIGKARANRDGTNMALIGAIIREVNDDGKKTGWVFGTQAPQGKFRIVTTNRASGATRKFGDFDLQVCAETQASHETFCSGVSAIIYNDRAERVAQFGG